MTQHVAECITLAKHDVIGKSKHLTDGYWNECGFKITRRRKKYPMSFCALILIWLIFYGI